jgi:hypothetical protein
LSNRCSFRSTPGDTAARFERIDDGARKGSDAQQRLRTARRRTKGGHFPARMGSSNRLGGPFGDVFLSERNFRPRVRRGVFRPKSRASPRCVTAGRTLERRHCLPGFHERRVEVTAASALPSDLHRQLDDRGGDLRRCLRQFGPLESIDPNDAMILPHGANPDRMKFSERTTVGDCCTAGFRPGSCRLGVHTARVMSVGLMRRRRSGHVRFTSDSVRTLAPQRNDALCQNRS